MFYLGIFDFYNIVNIVGSPGINILEPILTAILSGVIAWSVAFIQIDYSRFKTFQDDYINSFKTFELFRENLKLVHKISLEQIKYLKETIEFLEKKEDKLIVDQRLDTVPMKVLQNLSLEKLTLTLDNLNLTSSNRELFLKAYNASLNLYYNYEELRKFLMLKYVEYNSISDKHSELSDKVAVEIQSLIFSEEHKELMAIANQTDLGFMGPFRKNNPMFNIYQDLDKKTHEFQIKKSASWQNLRIFYESIRETIKDSNKLFPNVVLAQNIVKSITYLNSIDNFFESCIKTYKNYLEITEKQKEYFEATFDIQVDKSKEKGYFQSLLDGISFKKHGKPNKKITKKTAKH